MRIVLPLICCAALGFLACCLFVILGWLPLPCPHPNLCGDCRALREYETFRADRYRQYQELAAKPESSEYHEYVNDRLQKALRFCRLQQKAYGRIYGQESAETSYLQGVCQEIMNAIENKAILDGSPRVLRARLHPDAGGVGILWLESDFDTNAIVISAKNGSVIKLRLFDNTDTEELFFESPVRCISGNMLFRDLPAEPCETDIWSYASKIDDPTNLAFPFPEEPAELWIEDEAGNASNKITFVYSPAHSQESVPGLAD